MNLVPLAQKENLTPAQQEIQHKIDKYQAEYNKLTDEWTNINQKYISDVLALLEKYKDKEEDNYRLEAATKLAALEPANQLVQEYLVRLKKEISERGKSRMKPLFDGKDTKDWETSQGNWSTQKGNILGDALNNNPRPAVFKHRIQMEKSYLLSVSLKLDETHKGSPPHRPPRPGGGGGRPEFEAPYALGLVIAYRLNNLDEIYYVYCFGKDGNSALVKYTIGEGVERGIPVSLLETKTLPKGFNPTEWNKMAVRITGNTIGCYLNDELQFEVAVADEKTNQFKGKPGLSVTYGKASFKDIMYLDE